MTYGASCTWDPEYQAAQRQLNVDMKERLDRIKMAAKTEEVKAPAPEASSNGG